MKRCIDILKLYGYKIRFLPLHGHEDLKNYQRKPDAVRKKKIFTLITPSGLTVGRLFDITEKTLDLNRDHIARITGFFRMFDIESRNEILKRLQECYNVQTEEPPGKKNNGYY